MFFLREIARYPRITGGGFCVLASAPAADSPYAIPVMQSLEWQTLQKLVLKENCNMKKLLSGEQTCELLGCSPSTLNRLMNSGEFIPPVFPRKRGRRLAFDPDLLESWLRSRREAALANAPPTIKRLTEGNKERESFAQRQECARQKLALHESARRSAGRKKQ